MKLIWELERWRCRLSTSLSLKRKKYSSSLRVDLGSFHSPLSMPCWIRPTYARQIVWCAKKPCRVLSTHATPAPLFLPKTRPPISMRSPVEKGKLLHPQHQGEGWAVTCIKWAPTHPPLPAQSARRPSTILHLLLFRQLDFSILFLVSTPSCIYQ